jgi:hypothetical protein
MRTVLFSEFFLDSWPLKMEPIGCPETSVRNYHYWLRNNPEERNSQVPQFISQYSVLFELALFQWRRYETQQASSYKHVCGSFGRCWVYVGNPANTFNSREVMFVHIVSSRDYVVKWKLRKKNVKRVIFRNWRHVLDITYLLSLQ